MNKPKGDFDCTYWFLAVNYRLKAIDYFIPRTG